MGLRLLKNEHFKIEYPFSKYSYFSGASKEDRAALKRIRTIHHFKAGQSVTFNINNCDGFFYLHEGFTKVTYCRDNLREVIRIAGPNDIAGFARWHSRSGHYGLTTLSEVTASFFKKEDFLAIQNASDTLTSEVILWLMRVLISQEERLFSLKHSTAKTRIAGTLNELHHRFGKCIGGNNCIIAAPIDRKTLADLCGVAIEVLSRTLSEFEKAEIIKREGRIIIIENSTALEQLAYGK